MVVGPAAGRRGRAPPRAVGTGRIVRRGGQRARRPPWSPATRPRCERSSRRTRPTGRPARLIPVDYASHCAARRADCGSESCATLGPICTAPGAVPFYSTVTATELDDGRLDAGYWYRNLRETGPVRRRLREPCSSSGYTIFVESSPHPVLAVARRARPPRTPGAGGSGRRRCARDRGELAQFAHGARRAHAPRARRSTGPRSSRRRRPAGRPARPTRSSGSGTGWSRRRTGGPGRGRPRRPPTIRCSAPRSSSPGTDGLVLTGRLAGTPSPGSPTTVCGHRPAARHRVRRARALRRRQVALRPGSTS